MKTYSHDEMLDMVIGKRGTPRREAHEEAVKAFLMGEAVRQARLSKNLTQEQLGEMIGVKGAQVSRIEKGSNMTISTIYKIFNALGISASFNIEGVGTVSIC